MGEENGRRRGVSCSHEKGRLTVAKPTFTADDAALLDELGIEDEAPQQGSHTAREERIIAGFEDIQRFVDEHKRPPQHGEDKDIFERLYAVRLERLRAQPDCRMLLEPLDKQGLFNITENTKHVAPDQLSDDELLAELGIEAEAEADITQLKHVRSASDKRAAEDIASRERCADFENFKPLFKTMQDNLDEGVRISRPIRKEAGFLKTDIKQGEFFILGGQIAYVAEVGEPIKAPNGEADARLRVIYSNGTESNLLLRSLQRALYKDETSRLISEKKADAGPLFGDHIEPNDIESGTIYVLRSCSQNPYISQHRELIHKIGVTGDKVETRIANAAHEATYLLAEVEVVATYKLVDINRTKLEKLFHRIFAEAQVDITIPDRFGKLVKPKEWFLVPLAIINEAVERIKDGTITGYIYDPKIAKMVKQNQKTGDHS